MGNKNSGWKWIVMGIAVLFLMTVFLLGIRYISYLEHKVDNECDSGFNFGDSFSTFKVDNSSLMRWAECPNYQITLAELCEEGGYTNQSQDMLPLDLHPFSDKDFTCISKDGYIQDLWFNWTDNDSMIIVGSFDEGWTKEVGLRDECAAITGDLHGK